MGEEIRYYRGQHPVRVLTLSEGYWIVESLEEFEDTIDGQKVPVKVGEQRIVPPSFVFKQKSMPPVVKEHTYELQMEKKLKRLVTKEERAKKKQIS